MSPAASGFFELAKDHLDGVQRAAEAAAGDLERELQRLAGELAAANDPDADRVASIGAALVEHNRAIADRCARMRKRLEPATPSAPPATGDQAAAGARAPANGPSEGVELLARQMALSGAEQEQIEEVLTRLGVEDADDAIRRALG